MHQIAEDSWSDVVSLHMALHYEIPKTWEPLISFQQTWFGFGVKIRYKPQIEQILLPTEDFCLALSHPQPGDQTVLCLCSAAKLMCKVWDVVEQLCSYVPSKSSLLQKYSPSSME